MTEIETRHETDYPKADWISSRFTNATLRKCPPSSSVSLTMWQLLSQTSKMHSLRIVINSAFTEKKPQKYST